MSDSSAASGARLAGARFVLAVRNLAVSTKYYTEVLGFTLEPIDAPGWSFLSRDRVALMLGECPDDRDAGELANHSYFAYWYVNGVDTLYDELRGRGALIISAPADKPWGLREFAVRTLDGHRITCGEVLQS